VTDYEQVARAAEAIRSRLACTPEAAIVLGSGLGALVRRLESPHDIAGQDIPHWPPATVPGHAGRLVIGEVRGKAVAVVAGRTHLYEGRGVAAATFAVRVLGAIGVTTLILTSASGGIDDGLPPGTIVVVDDHLNLTGINPLVGADPQFGPRFVDMTNAYSHRLRAIADASAAAAGVSIAHAVYAGVLGPSYETPAEVKGLGRIGAGVVGMSIVHETIVARQMQMEVLGLSLVTNRAAGVTGEALEHQDVLAAAERSGPRITRLLEEIVGRL
jgi:purine-nucleoside phosphorylase